jgi:hypothetical protein
MIDFTKPIRHKDFGQDTIKVLFHDERSVLYELIDGRRFNRDKKLFEIAYQNVPTPKKVIKGFIGLYEYVWEGILRVDEIIYPTKDELKKTIDKDKLKVIIEINTYEGDGI